MFWELSWLLLSQWLVVILAHCFLIIFIFCYVKIFHNCFTKFFFVFQFLYPLVLLFVSLGSYRCLKTVIKVDTISVVHRNSKVVHLYTVLVDSLWQNLNLVENSFLEQISNPISSALMVSAPESYHFLPRECGHFVTVVYPKEKPDIVLGKH
jgi:hypothetical protein